MVREISKKEIVEIFMEKKVLTLSEVTDIFGCPKYTAKYYVKKCGAVTSFNKNAKYYSLSEIIEFDENGLWEYKSIRFSKYGTLKGTIIGIVKNSACGLSAAEISELLKSSPHSMFAALVEEDKLQRYKIGGCYIYFSKDEERCSTQLLKRKERNEQHSAKVVSDALGVLSLVEFIQNPGLNLQEISMRLSRKGVKITESLLHDFLSYHGLLKKHKFFGSHSSSEVN